MVACTPSRPTESVTSSRTDSRTSAVANPLECGARCGSSGEQGLLGLQHAAGDGAVGKQLGGVSVHRLAKAQGLPRVGDGVQPVEAVEGEQPNVPNFVLCQHSLTGLEVDGVLHRPVIFELGCHDVRVQRQQLDHVAQRHNLVGEEVAAQTQARHQHFPELLRSHKAVGSHGQQRIKPV